ncbi:MAG: hypothetical protein WBE43_05700 [Candidatus Acidiferrales bacterium]
MKINVKKLDATIEKLTQLRRLATDPALSDFIEITGVKTNSNGHEDIETLGNGHGALRANVLAACKTLGNPFTVKEVYAAMQTLGTTTESGTEKSVANILRLLASDGELLVSLRGQGRRPTAYSNN